MRFSTLKLTAAAAALALTPAAFAGGTFDLQSLIDGDTTLVSDSGVLSFSDFDFSPPAGLVLAVDVDVTVQDNGLFFQVPVPSNNTDYIDFHIDYVVTAASGYAINSATMESTGGVKEGTISLYKNGQNLFALINEFTTNGITNFATVSFDPQDSIIIDDDIQILPRGGEGGLSDFTQTYGVTAIPSPTAALAGMALLGVVGLRRRRQD